MMTTWFLIVWISVIFGVLIFFGVILLLPWVVRDSRCRGMDGAAVWILLILITGWIGLLVYLAARPVGVLIPCRTCTNKRLLHSRVCPHCGNP
jgi:hypothetical protein